MNFSKEGISVNNQVNRDLKDWKKLREYDEEKEQTSLQNRQQRGGRCEYKIDIFDEGRIFNGKGKIFVLFLSKRNLLRNKCHLHLSPVS